jgi:hypothetical protein
MGEINMNFRCCMSIASKTQGKKLKREISNGASLNLIMRKTFIEMCLNLKDLALVHDTFHEVIPGQSSTLIGRIDLEVSCGTFHGVIPGQSFTPIERIDLEVSCGTGDNKHKEMLTFEVASFDIGYNCILGGLFLLKFMVVIHTA